jgi:predicted dehydrogenase
MGNSDRIRFAVIGAGVIGDVHAQAIQRLSNVAELRLIVSTRAGPASALATARGAAGFSTDIEALWANPHIDAVTICTPSGSHADLAVRALDAGKHVILEKPIDISLAAADRVISAERTSGKKVAVISQHRFDRSTEKVVASVAAGRLGRLTSAIASCAWWRPQSYYDSAPWRGTWAFDGGGATINQAIHVIDLMVALMGAPTEVFAYTGCLAHTGIEVEDTAVAVVRFENGALGVIHATTAAYPGLDASLRLMGSQGSAVISSDELVFFHEHDPADPELTTRTPHAVMNQVTGDDALPLGSMPFGDAHTAQFADFINAVRTGEPVRVGSSHARMVLAVVLGMYESAATSRPLRLDHS